MVMDEITRMLAEVYAQDDKARAEYESHEWQRAQLQRRGMVYKRYETQTVTQPHTAVMDPATQKRWDAWVDARIRALLGPCLQVIGKKMGEENRKLREEIRSLRKDAS